jgi:hypothetical protein
MSKFGRLGGVSGEELISLEESFLKFIDFRLLIDEETYNMYLKAVVLFA